MCTDTELRYGNFMLDSAGLAASIGTIFVCWCPLDCRNFTSLKVSTAPLRLRACR